MNKITSHAIAFFSLLFISTLLEVNAQGKWDKSIHENMVSILQKHRELASIPNVSSNREDMFKNIDWVTEEFQHLDFEVTQLETSTLPVLLIEKQVNKKFKTVLFYMHLDGQDVDPNNWNQPNPFIPVLKEKDAEGNWKIIDWNNIEGAINPEWRVFGRAVADDKAPIIMMMYAMQLLKDSNTKPNVNIKIILDLQEESSCRFFRNT